MYTTFTPYSIAAKKSLVLLFSVICFLNFSFAQNAIVTENALPGNPASEWDIPTQDAGDLSIQGFGTSIGVNKGQSINFKIDVNTGTDRTFSLKIYRIGYYQGNGARLIADLGTITGIAQAACGYDATTGLMDCGNWTVTATWAVPSTAVSGLYIAKLTRSAAGGGGTSHITFVVRDDASTSDLYVQTSDATWQAYNGYGGNSLYVGAGFPFNHANKVSYNRPFITRGGGGGGGAQEDWWTNGEYPLIRFLEKNGYDISYTTNNDIAQSGNLILNHKVFISAGHDEYWSKEQRNFVEAARAAGKNLAFFSGNEVYWKTRWENSNDGTNTPFRTLVCYKEGTLATPQENACGGKCDPSTEWTGLWRDGCSFPAGNACKPENALTGEISWDGNTSVMMVPDTYKNLRFWRNTNITSLASGTSATLTSGTLGYEWDWEQYQSSYPSGRITMSSTSFDGHVHKLSLYKYSSGALVFGAGTVQWGWGLDQNHDYNLEAGSTFPADARMQQATVNLFADMGIQPATLQAGLVAATASTDSLPPATVITTPANGAVLPEGTPVTIAGTATDAGGGTVAGVEVSVDGGTTWQVATGTTSWTFSWTPSAEGSFIIKSRGFDDSGNMETPGGAEGAANSVTVTVSSAVLTNCPCTIFTPSQVPANAATNLNDGMAIELGVKFRSSAAGVISAIRFYKVSSDNALNTVQLWTLSGTLLGTATLTGTPTAGWNQVPFAAPISIDANTTYIATYISPTGYYAATSEVFTTAVINGPLTGIATSDPDGPNGVYIYTSTPMLPTQTFDAANYWVDVKFSPTSGPDITPPAVSVVSPASGATSANINSFVAATFTEDVDVTTVTSSTFQLKDATNTTVPGTLSYSSATTTATIVPTLPLAFSSTYTATIKGGASGVKDLAGNALVSDFVWSFTTGPTPPAPPNDGTGGPVLVISGAGNPFSRYTVEILRAEGYNAFTAMDITDVEASPSVLNNYDVIILGQIPLSGSDVTMLTTWTTAGGTLIALRPDAGLAPLLGLTTTGGTLADAYLLVNTTTGTPGAGIVNRTIQFHSTADLYTMQAGTTSLAMLYSTSSTATANPAITTKNVGTNGGKAIAFTYDLARSVVYTRQGNPAWAGTSRDGQTGPIRSDDLFFPDYVDFTKIAIPQADEQQHLLTNIMLLGNLHRKPMPHLWFLPRGLKAAVVMTGDDHFTGNTAGRFYQYLTLGPNTPQDVADWNAIRGTSYVYNFTPITEAAADSFQTEGFEIGLHPQNGCTDYTPTSLNSMFSTQLAQFTEQFPNLPAPTTNRTHCMPWTDWSTHPTLENTYGIRFDVNYYYWPGSWIQNRPGLFTGSGMPMRFAAIDGTIIDCYQAPTQMPDESQLDITNSINSLLDSAIIAGYYGAFVMNMHTDTAISVGSNEVIASAMARNIPVVSAIQMLTWIDSRNNTIFGPMTWTNNQLSFTITTSAHNLQAMVPVNSDSGTLIQIKQNGNPISFTSQTIKGIPYAFFAASTSSIVAVYSAPGPLPVSLLNLKATASGDDIIVSWQTASESNNRGFEVQRSKDAFNWTPIGFVNGAGQSDTLISYTYTDPDLDPAIYYYRLRQVDFDGNFTYSPVVSATISNDGKLALYQNYPNPFIQTTTIRFDLPRDQNVKLSVYDVNGREIKVLVNGFTQSGTHTISVDGSSLSSGLYYYKLTADDGTAVRKMIIK